MTLQFTEYQHESFKYALPTAKSEFRYLLPGLTGEVGELCSYYAKCHRDNVPLDPTVITKELGDILWFVSALALSNNCSLLEVAEKNLEKLASRFQRGKIGGSGDDR